MSKPMGLVMGWSRLDYVCTYHSPVHGPLAVHRHWWSSPAAIEARWRYHGGQAEIRREQQRRRHEASLRHGNPAGGEGQVAT